MNDDSQPWIEGVRGEQVLPLINSDERYVRVEAGPGTGKTFGLIRRVERILHPNGLNVPGEDVLVVAFNRVIAEQLDQEINGRLQESGYTGTGPVIKTIHALCISVSGAKRLLMPHEVDAMLYDIAETNPALMATYRKHSKIQQALRDHEAGHASHDALWLECVKWLQQHNANLISELPKMLLDRLRAGDLPDYRYSHIVVDEFQDLTPGEQQLMFRLLKPNGSLTALGDPRQSIYHFRGNDLEGLSKLEEITGSSIHDIHITECQRCPAPIVAAANSLMSDHTAAPMVAASTAHANNHVVVWGNPTKESEGMARAINANVVRNPLERHLIMVTRRKYGYRVRDELALLNPDLAVNISFSEGALETWPAREAFLAFCLLANPDAATWRAWFAYNAPTADGSFKSSKRNSPAYLSFLGVSDDVVTPEKVLALSREEFTLVGSGKAHVLERAKRYAEILERYRNLEPIDLINEVFNIANWDLTGCGEPATAAIDIQLLKNGALSTYTELEYEGGTISREEALAKITNRLRGQIAMREPLSTGTGPQVQIATLWSAKGVTAEHVYVLGLNAEMTPGKRRDDYPGTDVSYYEEQKRLFYVTITRSKKTLVLSRSLRIKRQDSRLMGITVRNPQSLWPELTVSPFLAQIISLLPDGVQGDRWQGC